MFAPKKRKPFRDIAAFLFPAILYYSTFPPAISCATGFCTQRKATVVKSLTRSSDSWKRNLLRRLEKVPPICGELCNVTAGDIHAKLIPNGNGNLPYLKVAKIDCGKLMALDEMEEGDSSFPNQPPEELLPHYTLNGAIPVTYADNLFKQQYVSTDAQTAIWKKEDIEADIERLSNGTLHGTYGNGVTKKAYAKMRYLRNRINGKRILVIGSEKPWVEVIALTLGAEHVVSLEYGNRKSFHPRITAMTPKSFRAEFLSGKLPSFDGAISFSSLEHSGLGRYGDSLNPWGDLLTVSSVGCVTKQNAFFALSVPFGPDELHWNAHRWYGRLRLPLMMANWKAVDPLEYKGNKGINDPEKNKENINKLFCFEKIS